MDSHPDEEDSDDDYDEDYDILPKKKCTEIRNCSGLFIYLKQNPKTAVACGTFLVSFACVLALGVAYAVDYHPNTCFFVAGIAGIVSNLYGFCHFRTLLNLKQEVDKYSLNNRQFADENQQLTSEVDRFRRTKEALKGTRAQFQDSIKRQKESLIKFKQLNTNLEATGKQNLEILGNLNEMASSMEDRWKEQLIVKERKILNICFDRFKWESGNSGISRTQYTQFKYLLPLEFQLRLTRAGDWDEIAGKDGILQYEEFATLLDNFAKELVTTQHEQRISSLHETQKSDLERVINDS